jgi:hypothetical protein
VFRICPVLLAARSLAVRTTARGATHKDAGVLVTAGTEKTLRLPKWLKNVVKVSRQKRMALRRKRGG